MRFFTPTALTGSRGLASRCFVEAFRRQSTCLGCFEGSQTNPADSPDAGARARARARGGQSQEKERREKKTKREREKETKVNEEER